MRHSRATQKNPGVEDWTEQYRGKRNLEFFRDAFAELAKRGVGNGGLMTIGLLGQRDLPGHALRTAQAILRWDLRPSYWSHAFLVAERVADGKDVGNVPILEVPLHARTGEFPRPEHNGVARTQLGLYDDAKVDANAALFAVTMDDAAAEEVSKRAENFNLDRIRFNLWETLGVWQAYLWSAGARPNPLREGIPVAASSYVEMAYEAMTLDLAVGTAERNSAPEHLWTAAQWWHEAFTAAKHPITGFFVLRDPGCAMLTTDE